MKKRSGKTLSISQGFTNYASNGYMIISPEIDLTFLHFRGF